MGFGKSSVFHRRFRNAKSFVFHRRSHNVALGIVSFGDDSHDSQPAFKDLSTMMDPKNRIHILKYPIGVQEKIF